MATKAEVLRTQYAPLPYHAKTVELDFELGDVTAIKSKVAYVTATPAATAAAGAAPADLVLDGDRKPAHMQLVKVLLNGAVLDKTQAVVNDAAQTLTIAGALLAGRPENVVEVHVTVEPAKNTGLNGLYQSSGNFCTQCVSALPSLVQLPSSQRRFVSTSPLSKTSDVGRQTSDFVTLCTQPQIER